MRDPRDFYRTPRGVILSAYEHLPDDWPTPTLDPAAGDGAICLATGCRGFELCGELASTAVRRGADVKNVDSLRVSWEGEDVIMNPPFKLAEEFVMKASREARSCLALLRLGFLSSQRRLSMWSESPPSDMLILSKRPSFTMDGRTDRYDYVWVGWRFGEAADRVRVRWV